MHRRRGMTLMELLVVLTILAILTTSVVVALNSGIDQARYDRTRQTLDAIQDAVVGPPDRPDAPNFLADLGRPPLAVGNDPTQLEELFAQGSLPPYALRTASDPDVKLLGGWRGPYLRVPAGAPACSTAGATASS